ncbi:MAG: putative Ig domain-containing protein, partial [Clostridia bacterium]|nr:putative Ig domain-containing protein [Clostridia bacterium]
MKKNFGNRLGAALFAVLIMITALPLHVLALNPVLTPAYASEFTVYEFTGATDDARNGTRISDYVIDLSQEFYFMTGNNVRMSGFCLWPVEEDELPPSDISNSGYGDKEYSSELLSLWSVSSSSLMSGTILGNNVGYDWDNGLFYANEGYTLQYGAGGPYYPEPGKYRFLMFYGNYVYYSDVYTITDRTGLAADQGVAEAVWVIDGAPSSVIPYSADENKAAFDMSILLPADVTGISSVRLLHESNDAFMSDSYYWSGVNVPGSGFQVGKLTDYGVFDEGHSFYLEDCEVTYMQLGSYRVKVIAGDGRVFIDNTVVEVKEVSTDPPTINTTSLPGAKVDVPYSACLEATPCQGGKITWTVTSGKLPDGLTLASDGQISGTPEKEGTFSFTVRASESGAGYADQNFTVSVSPPDLAIVGDGYFWTNNVDEQIKFGSSYSLGMTLNRSAFSDETVSAAVYYKTTGGATKKIDQTLETYGWTGASGYGQLPADAKSVERVEFFINGEKVATHPVGKSVAPALELNVTGSSGQYLYLSIYDESGECVNGYAVGYSGKTFNIDSLPSGTYRFMLSGTLYGFGYQNYGETTVTLKDGLKESVALPIVPHYATNINLESEAEG